MNEWTNQQTHPDKLQTYNNTYLPVWICWTKMMMMMMQKCNSNRINRNRPSQYAVYRVKKVKQKNTSKVKAAVGIALIVPCIR